MNYYEPKFCCLLIFFSFISCSCCDTENSDGGRGAEMSIFFLWTLNLYFPWESLFWKMLPTLSQSFLEDFLIVLHFSYIVLTLFTINIQYIYVLEFVFNNILKPRDKTYLLFKSSHKRYEGGSGALKILPPPLSPRY